MEEINLFIINRLGKKFEIKVPLGIKLNLMEVIKMNEDLIQEPNIGICGGFCMCASCHCYIMNDDNILKDINVEEELLLSDLSNYKNNSRLSCQINISQNLHGLIIHLAPIE